ncbi:hypothetical protein BDY19DRAFT_995456 [Irpex rosettiformis]|uniref:Uncharacterized protein n=1 Tax=Irpex rosettiformis TaxID=378272 RepID=A0ACB8TYG1_9APHY|nr:hypothetical protein BDY19DRAFT_995456 [Irpex rosettiformis]
MQVSADPEKAQSGALLPATHAGYSSTVYLHGQPVGMMPAQDPRTQRLRGRRFCVRLIHWLVLDIFLLLIILLTFRDFHKIVHAVKNAFTAGNSAVVPGDHEVHLPFDCVEVAEWDNADDLDRHDGYEHVVHTSVDLPISSDLLYFLGHGHLTHGIINFVDSNVHDSNTASVDVTFSYSWHDHDHEHDLSELLKVCRLHRAEGKDGVGIFSPERSHYPGGHYHRSRVEVVVQLPSSAKIKALDASLPLFVHELGDFHNSVTFGDIKLKTSNSPITAQFLTADKISLETSNSHIAGTFNSTDAIDVFTSNSFINGDFYLSNDAGSSNPSRINLHSRNAPVNAKFYLTSTAADQKQGSFNVDVQTSNSPLDVKFNDAPVDSRVTFIGKTSNSHALATLHETFEGKFSVSTGRWFEAGVHVEKKEDPSGKGRERHVSQIGSHRGHAEGKAFWGDADILGPGYAELTTSNSPAHLYF